MGFRLPTKAREDNSMRCKEKANKRTKWNKTKKYVESRSKKPYKIYKTD